MGGKKKYVDDRDIPFALSGRVTKLGIRALNDTDDDTEEAESTTENFYHQDLYEQGGILCIGQGTATSGNTYTNTILQY